MTANERCGDTGKNGTDRLRTTPIIVRCQNLDLSPKTIISKFVTVQSHHQLGINEITIYEPEQNVLSHQKYDGKAIASKGTKSKKKSFKAKIKDVHESKSVITPPNVPEFIYDEEEFYSQESHYKTATETKDTSDIIINELNVINGDRNDKVTFKDAITELPLSQIHQHVKQTSKKRSNDKNGLETRIKIKIRSRLLNDGAISNNHSIKISNSTTFNHIKPKSRIQIFTKQAKLRATTKDAGKKQTTKLKDSTSSKISLGLLQTQASTFFSRASGALKSSRNFESQLQEKSELQNIASITHRITPVIPTTFRTDGKGFYIQKRMGKLRFERTDAITSINGSEVTNDVAYPSTINVYKTSRNIILDRFGNEKDKSNSSKVTSVKRTTKTPKDFTMDTKSTNAMIRNSTYAQNEEIKEIQNGNEKDKSNSLKVTSVKRTTKIPKDFTMDTKSTNAMISNLTYAQNEEIKENHSSKSDQLKVRSSKIKFTLKSTKLPFKSTGTTFSSTNNFKSDGTQGQLKPITVVEKSIHSQRPSDNYLSKASLQPSTKNIRNNSVKDFSKTASFPGSVTTSVIGGLEHDDLGHSKFMLSEFDNTDLTTPQNLATKRYLHNHRKNRKDKKHKGPHITMRVKFQDLINKTVEKKIDPRALFVRFEELKKVTQNTTAHQTNCDSIPTQFVILNTEKKATDYANLNKGTSELVSNGGLDGYSNSKVTTDAIHEVSQPIAADRVQQEIITQNSVHILEGRKFNSSKYSNRRDIMLTRKISLHTPEGTGIQTTLESIKENKAKMESVKHHLNVKHHRNINKLRKKNDRFKIFKLG